MTLLSNVVAMVFWAGASIGNAPALLLETLVVNEPPPSVTADAAAFSGFWHGRWEDCVEGALAVVNIHSDQSVDVVHAWSACTERNIEAGSASLKGRITGAVLTLERFGVGVVAVYELQPNGALEGSFLRHGKTMRGIFHKQ